MFFLEYVGELRIISLIEEEATTTTKPFIPKQVGVG
jgi:hypothetical protein